MTTPEFRLHYDPKLPDTIKMVWLGGDFPDFKTVQRAYSGKLPANLKVEVEIANPEKTGYPLGLTIFPVRWTPETYDNNCELFKLGVTAIDEWWVYDRYRTETYETLRSILPSTEYPCAFLYHTYDAPICIHTETEKQMFPEMCAKEDKEWEAKEEQIKEIIQEWDSEQEPYSYFPLSIRSNPRSEDLWPLNVPYEKGMSETEKFECYKEFLMAQIEYEKCNHRR